LAKILPEHGNNSTRNCGNCKREYKFNRFIEQYSKLHHDRITELWQNPEIRFYCPYCYFLKIIKEINKN
jgi:hypothetical protein